MGEDEGQEGIQTGEATSQKIPELYVNDHSNKFYQGLNGLGHISSLLILFQMTNLPPSLERREPDLTLNKSVSSWT